MIYPYMTLADETEIVHTQILYEDGMQKIEVHFERPTENGFNTARCCLPTYDWIIRDGFTDEEIQFFKEFLKYNAHLIYRFAQNGGMCCA